MARCHGMMFHSEGGEPLSLGVNHGEATWYLRDRLPQKYEDDVYVIHTDSLHLLDPAVGDMVTNTSHGNKGRECSGLVEGFLNGGASAVITTCERHNGKRHFVEDVGQLTILQRNGNPFFLPESEPE